MVTTSRQLPLEFRRVQRRSIANSIVVTRSPVVPLNQTFAFPVAMSWSAVSRCFAQER